MITSAKRIVRLESGTQMLLVAGAIAGKTPAEQANVRSSAREGTQLGQPQFVALRRLGAARRDLIALHEVG